MTAALRHAPAMETERCPTCFSKPAMSCVKCHGIGYIYARPPAPATVSETDYRTKLSEIYTDYAQIAFREGRWGDSGVWEAAAEIARGLIVRSKSG